MSIAQLTAGQVMDLAAALLNDAAKTTYTYAVQIPYLNMAIQELQEYYELNSLPVTEQVTSPTIPMDAGKTVIAYDVAPEPELPDDFVDPAQVWESPRGLNQWTPMTRNDYLPHNWEGVQSNQFIWFAWQSQEIRVLPANQDNDIKIDYIRQVFNTVTASTDTLNVVNAKTFLYNRTAALITEFIERDTESAQSLTANASIALDRSIGIGAKGKQAIMTRRRPFRQAYKRLVRF